MELNDELKLLLIKTEAHKNDAAATGVFNTIRDLDDIDENSAYKERLEMFYSKHPDLGTTDSDGVWTEPTEAELTAALIENEYVNPIAPEIWELEKYEEHHRNTRPGGHPAWTGHTLRGGCCAKISSS